MNKYIHTDPWCLIEEGFHESDQLASETIFSLGNGEIGQRANLEEYYSGETMLGSYVAGIYYPEEEERLNREAATRQITDKIVNALNWTGIVVFLNDEKLDLATWEIQNFKRILNMREGYLERTFDAISKKGHHIEVSVKRILSMAETEIGAIHYSVKSLNFEGRISFMPIIDGDFYIPNLINDGPIWNVLQTMTQADVAHLWTQTRRTDYHVCAAMTYVLCKNNERMNIIPAKIEKEKVAGFSVGTNVKKGDTLYINKYVAILNSLNHPRKELTELACSLAREAKQKGWSQLLEEHTAVWAEKWNYSDVSAEVDMETQQVSLYRQFRIMQGLDGNDKISDKR